MKAHGMSDVKTKILKNTGSEVTNNRSTRIFAIIFGLLTGIGGAIHGFFEIARGNVATEGIALPDIGAVSLIPNYLISGIVAAITSLLVIIWTIGFLHKKHGPAVFILLSITLFLVGGGIGQIILFLVAWVVATRIHSPLRWWGRVLPSKSRKYLARFWFPLLLTGGVTFSVGFGIWLLAIPPGELTNISLIYYVCWIFLIIGVLVLLIALVCGFARDLELRGEHNIIKEM